MKYRSRTDIIAMILQAAMNGATKTRLMYSAYLSYAQVQEYLGFLTDRKLISFEDGSQEYKLTEQGLRFLRVYDEISEIVSLNNNKGSERVTPGLMR
jgi:predicted transcriptional regulator